MNVKFTGMAIRSINQISIYIASEGFPETSEKFANELYEFAQSIGFFPTKHKICSSPVLFIKQIRCAIFKNYIFLFTISENTIIIRNVVHSKRMIG